MAQQNPPRGPFFIMEVTQACNNNCQYCYNVWKRDKNYPRGNMDTETWKKIIKKIKAETPSTVLSFTGGEPTMRKDLAELIQYASDLGFSVNLITNGTNLTEESIKSYIDAGVTLFELPLLSGGGKEEIHDDLARHDDSWKKVIKSMKLLKKYDATVVGVVVVTKKNIKDMKNILETAVVLDLYHVMFNRFCPGGEGAKHIEELLPSVKELKESLAIAEKAVVDYGITISCNISIQPCLIDMSKYPHLSTGYCAVGTENAYYGIDSLGNMRPCNHSPTIIGSFLEQSYEELMNSPILQEFIKAYPPICEPCPSATTCQGGCKASAQVCYGSIYEEEPFLKLNLMDNPMLRKAKEKMIKEGKIKG